MSFTRHIASVKNGSAILYLAITVGLLFCNGCIPGYSYTNAINDKTYSEEFIVIDNYDGFGGGGEIISQTFNRTPQRIIAVCESSIDNLLFLGLGDRIVGISYFFSVDHSPYADWYKKLPRAGKENTYPTKENVLALEPDIIVGWGSLFDDKSLGSVKDWHKKGIHTYLFKNTVPTRTVGNRKVVYFLDDLRNLAKIFHVSDDINLKIDKLQNRFNIVEEKGRTIAKK